jgi:hypothetical protein
VYLTSSILVRGVGEGGKGGGGKYILVRLLIDAVLVSLCLCLHVSLASSAFTPTYKARDPNPNPTLTLTLSLTLTLTPACAKLVTFTVYTWVAVSTVSSQNALTEVRTDFPFFTVRRRTSI